MRAQYDLNEKNGNFRTSTQFAQTPRVANRPNIPIDTSRRSTTPTRIQQRVSNSPLKAPLSNAINKALRTKEQIQMEKSGQSQSRYMGRSTRRDESPIISMAKKIYYEQDSQNQQLKTHPETYNFIRKYFQTINLEVPLQKFIQKIMQQYETLWGTQNAEKIFDDFTYKIADIFGNDYVDLRQLGRITKQDGMIGLILRIFKEIKSEQNTRNSNYASFTQNPQIVNLGKSFQQKLIENESVGGLKNVIQQFMESMYQAMESEIYEKFNVEMRRMIVKYRQAEKLLKKVNQKINNYADVIDFDLKFKQKDKKYELIIQQLTKKNQKALSDLEKEKQSSLSDRKQKEKLYQECNKLKQTLEKYQNVLLTKALQNNNTQPNLNRQTSNQSRISTMEPMKNSQINSNPQPFKITIDTHVVHKENMPPETKTFTTFHTTPTSHLTTLNPVQRESYDSRPSQFIPSPSPFSTSRITTIRPLSPTPLSPYHSRITRPL